MRTNGYIPPTFPPPSFIPLVSNSPLLFSASIERVFRYGSDILRSKRSALSFLNFEKLVFIKGNLKIIKNNLQELEEEIE